MELVLKRFKSNAKATLGTFLIDNVLNGYVCEDAYHVVKIPKQTRIPAGKYQVILKPMGSSRMDPAYLTRFGKEFHKGMLQLQDVPNFSGVLIHIGNTAVDTDGCLLIGSSYTATVSNLSVQGSKDAYEKIYPQIRDALLAGDKVYIDVRDNDMPIDHAATGEPNANTIPTV